jgi:hypothetical protein
MTSPGEAMKICRGCQEQKPAHDFYRHRKMADGRLNHCRECVRKRVREHRLKNVEAVRAYDRRRSLREERRADSRVRSRSRTRRPPVPTAKYRLHRWAHSATWNAIRAGQLVAPERCEVCGAAEKLEAHHEDYRRPLEVRWLCAGCHGNRHREINDLLRSGADLSEQGF